MVDLYLFMGEVLVLLCVFWLSIVYVARGCGQLLGARTLGVGLGFLFLFLDCDLSVRSRGGLLCTSSSGSSLFFRRGGTLLATA